MNFKQKRTEYREMLNRKRMLSHQKNLAQQTETQKFYLRSFQSALVNRLTQEFTSSENSINADLTNSLEKIRGRSRQSFQNNDHYIRYIKRYKTGVVGAQGFTLASKAKDEKGKEDKNAIAQIEEAWEKFGYKENFSVSKRISFHKFCLICESQKKRDGEVFIHIVEGFDNAFGIAIEIIEPHYLDETYNIDLENGNVIRNGIEFNERGQIVNYHFSEKPKNEHVLSNLQKYGKKYKIPANEIIHYFDSSEYSQNRGYPDGQQVMLDIHNLKGINSAEVIKRRVNSCNSGFVIPPEGGEFKGDGINSDGSTDFEVEAGTMRVLPPGSTVEQFDTHDQGDGNARFNKLILQNFSVGVGLSYHSISGDYEGLNKEALRDATINDRDEFGLEQSLFIEDVLSIIFYRWLRFSLLSKAINLPLSKIDSFKKHEFLPRAFQAINELEEAQANDISINNATKSRTQINKARNEDQEEIFKELSAEEQYSQDYEVPLRNQGGTASMNLLNDMPSNPKKDTSKEKK